MSVRRKAAAIGLGLLLVLGASACGGSDEAEEPTKKPSASASEGDVDVDAEDGTVKYTDGDGNKTEMNLDGTGAALPEGWPEDLDPPDSVTVITSRTSTDGSEMTVLGEAEGSIDDLTAALEQQITDAGFEITQNTSSEITGGGYSGLTADKGDQQLIVSIATDTVTKGKITISMAITPKG